MTVKPTIIVRMQDGDVFPFTILHADGVVAGEISSYDSSDAWAAAEQASDEFYRKSGVEIVRWIVQLPDGSVEEEQS